MCIPYKTEFISIWGSQIVNSSVKKCLSSLFPLDKIEDSSTQQTPDHLLWAGAVLDAQRQATFDLYPQESWFLKVQFQIC